MKSRWPTISVASSTGARDPADLWENARLFGLLNLADGYVATFATRYRDNFWRPVTAIREADDDGHPDSIADPMWTPLAPAPPVPDHDSRHSVEGGAAAHVLKRFFHTDHVSFSTCSLTLPPGFTCADTAPVLRPYGSFMQAAEENGLSRILAGFHFRNAVKHGIQHGRAAHASFLQCLRWASADPRISPSLARYVRNAVEDHGTPATVLLNNEHGRRVRLRRTRVSRRSCSCRRNGP